MQVPCGYPDGSLPAHLYLPRGKMDLVNFSPLSSISIVRLILAFLTSVSFAPLSLNKTA
jgi:hypothetical protein